MPVKFRCTNCRQRLSAATRKIGHRVNCPKCKAPITVPDDGTKDRASPSDSETDRADRDAAGGVSDFIVYDQEPVVIEDDWEEPGRPRDQTTAVVDRTLVAVSRRVLYAQGVAICVVALVAFILGYVIGHFGSPRHGAAVGRVEPASISGKVFYRNTSGELVGDGGAVIIVLPEGQSPSGLEKPAVDDLGPLEAVPPEDHPGVLGLQTLGGVYARADDTGNFRLTVPEPGKYYVLLLSHHTARSGSVVKSELAAMASHFRGALDLIADRKYHWSIQQLGAGTFIRHDFSPE